MSQPSFHKTYIKNRLGFRVCFNCKIEKPLSDYSGTDKGKGTYHCRLCLPGHVKRQMVKRKTLAFERLGGYKCRCCGVEEKEFLTIDHINGGGNLWRKQHPGGDRIYGLIKSLKFPELEFQVLCMNCNWAKGKYGQCPHTKTKERTTTYSQKQSIPSASC